VAGKPATELVRWHSSDPLRGAERRNRTVRQAISGDMAVAEAATALTSLEVADVVYSSQGEPMSWLAATLDRYPGCAVAGFPAADGRYLLATRECRMPLVFRLLVNETVTIPGSGAAMSGMFVHAWLAAGWPLAALRPAILEPVVPHAMATLAQVPFGLYYEGPSSASRCRMSPVSGASIPE